jgi:hypothetical protein
MGRRKVFSALIVVSLVAAVGGFPAVGHRAARPGVQGFDWELASIFGTAVGTVLLAAATGFLAVMTWSDVTATQEIAQQGREERVARERRLPVRVLLSRRLREGREILRGRRFHDAVPWRDRVYILLRESLGGSEADLFLSTPEDLEAAGDDPTASIRGLDAHLQVLDDILATSESWVVDPEFDPKGW